MKEPKIRKANIAELIPDDKNFNQGSEYGKHLLDKSFEKFGAGRSILLDKNNRIIAGNKATESFGEGGGENVLIVETDGKTLVAVKRTDIDLDSKVGRELAMADNATQKADLVWDEVAIREVSEEYGIDPADWGIDNEFEPEAEQVEPQEDNFNPDNEHISVRCKPGDVWQLGEHRLMCGDSIDLEVVKKLMGGGRS